MASTQTNAQLSRQQISRGHIGKLLDRRQNNWENFLYNKRNKDDGSITMGGSDDAYTCSIQQGQNTTTKLINVRLADTQLDSSGKMS